MSRQTLSFLVIEEIRRSEHGVGEFLSGIQKESHKLDDPDELWTLLALE